MQLQNSAAVVAVAPNKCYVGRKGKGAKVAKFEMLVGDKFVVEAETIEDAYAKLALASFSHDEKNGVEFIEVDTWVAND